MSGLRRSGVEWVKAEELAMLNVWSWLWVALSMNEDVPPAWPPK